MYIPSKNWHEQLKNLIQEVMNQKEYVLDGIVTSVNNSLPYTVKVQLEPYGIETGWLPVRTSYAGNGYGMVLPPPSEGSHVQVIFSMGNVNSGIVIGGTYNDVNIPPSVNFGDAAIFHESGSSIVLKSDGSIVFTSKSGAFLSLDGADKTVTISGSTSQSW